MMNHGGGPALPEGQVEHLQHQFRAQMSCHRPADDSASESVEHHRQIKKPGPGRISATRNRLGAAATKLRSTTGAGRAPRARTVVATHLRRLTPHRPAAFIKRATRLRPRWMPAANSSS